MQNSPYKKEKLIHNNIKAVNGKGSPNNIAIVTIKTSAKLEEIK